MGTNPTSTTPGAGQQQPEDSVGDFNPLQFLIKQALLQVSTIKIVSVLSVDTDKHTVGVQIAVNQLDGNNNSTPHGQIFNIPYIWAMGGTNAFQIDPAAGDMGVMLCCDRDISSVKANQAIANPGSARTFSPSDGIYLFGIPGLNGTAPTQWFKWLVGGGFNLTDSLGNVQSSSSAGISINGLVINQQGQIAGALPVTGALELGGAIEALAGGEYAGNISTTGTVSAANVIAAPGAAQVTLLGHEHSANNTPPTPGH